MASKTLKNSGKGAKQGAKARSSAQPVRKAAAKPVKKAAKKAVVHGKGAVKPTQPGAAARGKKAAKPAKAAAAKRPAVKKPTAKKAVAKGSPAARAESQGKSKPGAKSKAPAAKPLPEVRSGRVSPIAPRHPQRRSEMAAGAAQGGGKVKPAASTSAPAAVPAARPAAATRPQPAAKRPFSRESVRVGEAKLPQPAGARPVFPAAFLVRQRERLQDKKLELLAMYQKDLKNGKESNDSPTEDLVDRANNAYTRELAFSISDSERELMRQIDLAIERLDSGSYGFCLHTGQQIGEARLEAIPWAKYSVEAQELLEKGLLSEG